MDIHELVDKAFPVLTGLAGAALGFFADAYRRKTELRRANRMAIRSAYATWIIASQKVAYVEHHFLIVHRSVTQVPGEPSDALWSKQTKAQSDYVLAIQEEDAAFVGVMLIDSDRDRVRQAEQIRKIEPCLHVPLDPSPGPAFDKQFQEFSDLQNDRRMAISKFAIELEAAMRE